MQIIPPNNCPCCGSKLERVNDQLYCRNTNCDAQLQGKVAHFAKTLGIKGLGEKTIEKLGLDTILDIYSLDKEFVTLTLGEKVATKLIAEIDNSKASDFQTVLSALSIPLVGGTASSKLAVLVNSFTEITADICKEAGLGAKVTSNLINWLEHDYLVMYNKLPFEFKHKAVKKTLDKGVICITGKLKSFKVKADAKVVLEGLGFTVVDSLTKAVTILVDESGSISAKRTTAEQRGITIVTDLNQFIILNKQEQ
jgi:NAD-dependent DNA ligase